MRVGLDGYPLAAPPTGVGHYTLELAQALALLAPDDSFELISPFPFEPSIQKKLDEASPANLAAVNPRGATINRRWWAAGLPLYLWRNPFDVFHGTNYDVPLWNRKQTVVTIHDLSILLHPQNHQRHLVRRARRRLPLMARAATMVITPSESVKREVCEHLNINADKIVVTPEAPRRSFRPVPIEETVAVRARLGVEADFILFVGTIEPRKNLLTLMLAFDDVLRHSAIRPQLVIAGGEGWLMDEFFSFVEKSGAGERVRFTGYLTDEDLRALYSSCRICIYPSLYEGFGLPPLEAMACGAPVITSNIPAIVETVGVAACLVDPLDVSSLAKTLVELWNDDARRGELSEMGQRRAATFSWERTARLTYQVYQEVLLRRKKS
ncbi:MAG: glycosyltransferase family 1 protein [bacterium]